MTNTDYSENALVEQPAIALFEELGWPSANCFYEKVGPTNTTTYGRETTNDVILWPRLRAAIKKHNPGIANDAVQLAMDELAKDRSAMSLAHANREIYKLLKEGVRISFQNDDGEEADETVRVIEWNDPGNNDYFLASQFWVSGNIYKRRVELPSRPFPHVSNLCTNLCHRPKALEKRCSQSICERLPYQRLPDWFAEATNSRKWPRQTLVTGSVVSYHCLVD